MFLHGSAHRDPPKHRRARRRRRRDGAPRRVALRRQEPPVWGSARAAPGAGRGVVMSRRPDLTEATSLVQILRASPTRPFNFEGASPSAASRASPPRRGSINTSTQDAASSVVLSASALADDDNP